MNTFKEFFAESSTRTDALKQPLAKIIYKVIESGNNVFSYRLIYGASVYRDEEGFAHRDNGPALITYFVHDDMTVDTGHETEHCYYKHGLRHRLDGPAVECFDIVGDDQYYINGKRYTKTQFDKVTKHVDPENVEGMIDIQGLF